MRVGEARRRHRFGVDKENFRVILVGKDGGVKRSDTTPVQATALFEQIDAMPMRQQEMRSSRQKVAIKFLESKLDQEAVRSAESSSASLSQLRQLEGRDVEPSAGVIDSQTVKTTEKGGIDGYDAGKKINGRGVSAKLQ